MYDFVNKKNSSGFDGFIRRNMLSHSYSFREEFSGLEIVQMSVYEA